MKKEILLAAAGRAAIAAIALGLLACADDPTENPQPRDEAQGDPIRFTCDYPQTRTAFGDSQDGEIPIYWSKGDKVSICYRNFNQMLGDKTQSAVYEAQEGGTNSEEFAPEAGTAALQWGSYPGHTFCAFYPASAAKEISATSIGESVSAVLPTFQQLPENGSPDMTYAHMTAISRNAAKEDGTVSLSFRPSVTVLDISFAVPEATTIFEIVVSSETKAVAGTYKTAYSAYNEAGTLYSDATTSSKRLVIRFPGGGKTVAANTECKVTAFLLPQTYEGLRVDVVTEAGIVGKSSSTTFEPARRYGFPMGTLPSTGSAVWKSLYENWMSCLPDNVYISELSIPGAHDAATAGVTITPNLAKCQDRTIPDQLLLGVRYLDLRPNKDLKIYHGIIYANKTFDEAVKDMFDYLNEHPQEFCIAQIKHENDTNSSFNEKMSTYMGTSDYKDKFIPSFRSDLTLGECRGKILFFSREHYADQIVGAELTGWGDNSTGSSDNRWIKKGADQTSYYLQDCYDEYENQSEKQSYLVGTMDYARVTKKPLEWVINFSSGAKSEYLFESGIKNTVKAQNPNIISQLRDHPGRTGVLVMDYAGSDNYQGKGALNAIIDQNRMYYPGAKE